jgi:hypothetical protein
VLNVRKLAAIDLYFLGSKFILAEFGFGMAASVLWDGSRCVLAFVVNTVLGSSLGDYTC